MLQQFFQKHLRKWSSRSIRRDFRRRPCVEYLEERLAPAIDFDLILPRSSAFGLANSLAVKYTNTGTTDEAAPLVVVSADHADLWLPTSPAVKGSDLQLLATSSTGDAGTLAPGEQGTIHVHYTATSRSPRDIHFTLNRLASGRTIDWGVIQDDMRPSYIPEDAWDAVFANFTARVGSTTDSYQAALGSSASYLGQFDEPMHDVGRLIGFQINQADNAFAVPASASSVDAAMPAPGPSLRFSRWILTTISGRHRLGTLGRGWVHNWDITANTDDDGHVTIDAGGNPRHFSKDSDGNYTPALGDHGTLTPLSDDGFELHELGGGITVFNNDGTLSYVQDTNGNRITATYTGGLLSRLTHSNGSFLTLAYSNGRLTRVTDSAGRSNTYTYDVTGEHLLTHTDEYGTTTYDYVTSQGVASQHALSTIAYADNTHVYFNYDAQGRLIEGHRDNNQRRHTVTYEPFGGFTITNANHASTRVLPDDSGQIRELVNPLGQTYNYTFNTSGDVTEVNGPEATRHVFGYDLSGNLTLATNPLGLTTAFTYNAAGDLTSYTDAKGNTTNYRYDNKSNLLAITYANGSEKQFNYNPLGEVAEYINPNGRPIDFTYNNKGQITRATFADGSIYAYSYDTRGNIRSAFSADGTITFQYQDNARPDLITRIDYPEGKSLKFAYNIVGQRTQSVDHTGFTVNYTYDALGRLQQLTDDNGDLIVSYSYDAAGYLIQKDLGNGTRSVYIYDKAGQLLSIKNLAPDHTTVNSFNNYTYDPLGNVVTDSNQDGEWQYDYDAAGQLIEAIFTLDNSGPESLPSQHLQYVYDAANNRLSQTVNSVTTTYVVNNVNEYTSSTTGGVTTNYQYDLQGNRIAKITGSDTTTYAYNDFGQMVGVNSPDLTASYTYDPLGHRNSRTVNGVTTKYLLDPFGLGHVTAEFTSVGGVIAHYTRGFGLTSRVDASGDAAYYDFNLTGHTIGMTDTAGQFGNRYSYLPFGKTTTIKETVPNAFTFVGQFGVMQNSAELFHMRARTYSADVGQFLSNDPIGLAGGDTNIRRYVYNDPVRFIDPSGHGLEGGGDGGGDGPSEKDIDNPFLRQLQEERKSTTNSTTGGHLGNNSNQSTAKKHLQSENGNDLTIDFGSEKKDDKKEDKKDDNGQNDDQNNNQGGDKTDKVTTPELGQNPGPNCFPPHTPVATETGLRPISEIQEGDRVWAFDFVRGVWQMERVLRRYDAFHEGLLLTLEIGSDEIQTTGHHPFWVIEGRDLDNRPSQTHGDVNEDRGGSLPGRWVSAMDLEEGDVFFLRNSGPVTLRRVTRSHVRMPVCNLAIPGLHTFAVGKAQVLVHNVFGKLGEQAGEILQTVITGISEWFEQFGSGDKTTNEDTTDVTPSLIEGVPITLRVYTGSVGEPITSAEVQFTHFEDESKNVKAEVVDIQRTGQGTGPFEQFSVDATVTFPETGVYGITVIVNGKHIVIDPHRASVIVYDAAWSVTPTQLTTPAGGVYQGPIATFHDPNPFGNPAYYSATSTTVGSPTIVGGGGYYTVYGTVDYSHWTRPGTSNLLVRVWDQGPGPNPKGGKDVFTTVLVGNPGTFQSTTSVHGIIINMKDTPQKAHFATVTITGSNSGGSRLLTAPSANMTTARATSAPHVTATSSFPGVAVTDYVFQERADGSQQIQIHGIVNPLTLGSGIKHVPLDISIDGNTPIPTTFSLRTVTGDFVVNSAPVTVESRQTIRDLQVAVLSGPTTGNYSATISWGDGETSQGRITALGGEQFAILGSKPSPYSAVGNYTITVTAYGPGAIPSAITRSTATVITPVVGLNELGTLRKEYGFRFAGSYYQNAYRQNEKWFQDRDKRWFAIIPDGTVYEWKGIANQLGNVVAQVNAAVYDNPNLLFHAEAPLTDVEADQLSQLGRTHGFRFSGNYYEDLYGYGEKWFQDRDGNWYTVISDGSLFHWRGRRNELGTEVATVVKLVYDDPNLLFTAKIKLSAQEQSLFASLQQTHGFHYVGSFYENSFGHGEKWFQDKDGKWFALTSDGGLYEWQGVARNLGTEISQLTGFVFDDPGWLFRGGLELTNSAKQQLANLQNTYGFRFAGTFYQNSYGQNEKWFKDKSGNWYALAPDGTLYAWNGQSGQLGVEIAKLLAPVWFDPRLLWNGGQSA